MAQKKSMFIEIGGCPYSRKALLKGWEIWIVGYDINTERHLIVYTPYEKNQRIELDNADLKLREKYSRSYS